MKPDSKILTKTKTNRNEHVSIDPARPGSQSDYPGSPNEFLTKRHGDQDLPPKTAWFLGDFSVVSFFFCPYWCQTRQNLASALLMMSNFGSYKRISLQIIMLILWGVDPLQWHHNATNVNGLGWTHLYSASSANINLRMQVESMSSFWIEKLGKPPTLWQWKVKVSIGKFIKMNI